MFLLSNRYTYTKNGESSSIFKKVTLRIDCIIGLYFIDLLYERLSFNTYFLVR